MLTAHGYIHTHPQGTRDLTAPGSWEAGQSSQRAMIQHVLEHGETRQETRQKDLSEEVRGPGQNHGWLLFALVFPRRPTTSKS